MTEKKLLIVIHLFLLAYFNTGFSAEINGPNFTEGTVVKVVLDLEPNSMLVELNANNRAIWIIGPFMNIKTGDTLQYSRKHSVVVKNFHSSLLNRKFESIEFVPSLTVIK